MTPLELIDQSSRIIIKIGSALISDADTGQARQGWINNVAKDIDNIVKSGKEVAIVSSGAIALGRSSLGISKKTRPTAIPLEQKQAAAALGQVLLSNAYQEAFKPFNIQTAMVLLSPKDTEERKTHLNARATLQTLLKNGKVPIINENDTVSTEEIRFGDNDRLAARVAQMIEADLLIQLSTTDGLYTGNPQTDPQATHIPLVNEITDDMRAMAQDAAAGVSTGGMKSKLIAADIATKAGVHMVITSGACDHPLSQIGKATIFKARDSKANARKRWLASTLQAQGAIIIDDGAVRALQNGKSLLPAGIVSISGAYGYGDPVAVQDQQGRQIGIGLTTYSSEETQQIIGKASQDIPDILGFWRNDAVIHRSDLALI